MLIKKEKPSKLLLILFEYFGFAILCGFVSVLFFSWAAKVIIENYMKELDVIVAIQTEYWIAIVNIIAGILIAFFVLILLFQQKFAYMVEISKAVSEMEAGNLSKRISIVGDDELTDLAVRINALAETVEEEIAVSEQMKAERFQSIASLSHDIRTPLTAVMSYLQFIRDEQYSNSNQLKSYAEKAYEKAYRIKEMTDSLFENCVKDIEDKKPLEKVDGNSFLKQVFFDIEDFLEEAGFTVCIVPIPEERLFFIEINRESMARIFDNMISNIEKYADRSQPIKVHATFSQENLIIQQENIVIEEYQKESVESHLLGLKGVHKMLKEMGGTVYCEEQGGIFRLTMMFPIH